MTATYTQPWATTRDFLRFLVSDTDTSSPIWQDEELDSLLTYNSSDPRIAAAEALEALASKYARNAISYGFTGFELDRTKVAEQLLKRANVLRTEAASIPFEFESILDYGIDAQGIDRSNYPTSAEGEEPVA